MRTEPHERYFAKVRVNFYKRKNSERSGGREVWRNDFSIKHRNKARRVISCKNFNNMDENWVQRIFQLRSSGKSFANRAKQSFDRIRILYCCWNFLLLLMCNSEKSWVIFRITSGILVSFFYHTQYGKISSEKSANGEYNQERSSIK